MMQAFNKKLDNLQKDLDKVKRNQAGTQQIPESVTSKRILGVSNVGRKVTGNWNVKEQQ
jgi:hypothetical protein